jgi:PAS domain S-box-containing protein
MPTDAVQALFDAVPGGFVHVAMNGSILSANAEACRILGYRFDDLTKRFVTDFETTTIGEDGEDFPASEYPVSKALVTGEPQPPVTIGIRRPDGQLVWAVFRAAPARDETGALTGAVVTFIDITERKRSEEELQRRENQWRSLAENLPDYVIIVDRDARIQSINRTLRFDYDKLIGSYAWANVHDDHREDWKKLFAAVLETQTTRTLEVQAFAVSGPMVWYEVSFVPIAPTAGEGRVERILIVARDTTARRKMIASLAEKERLASVGMLSASVAHEIMNPLTYVLSNLDFALSDRCPPGPRMTKAIEAAREGAVRMQQIVWDLRSLGRTGTQELFYVDVRSIVETAVRLAGPEIGNVGLSVELAEVPGVLASESRLCQVFINILVNAAQAVHERPVGQRAVRVCTRTDEPLGFVGVEFADTGCGIEPEHLSRIYDPLFTTKPTGTGLGLSISKESVEAMGGRIEVVSETGVGTTFTVWLSTNRVARSA